MSPLIALTDEFLLEHFSEETLSRARGYVDDAVTGLEVSQLSVGSVTATADVFGTRAVPYQVQLHAEVGPRTGRGWVFSVCTCPVRAMCKHGAAVALALRQGPIDAGHPPGWTRRLDTLVEELAAGAAVAADPDYVALQLTFDAHGSYYDPRPMVRLQPMRPGKKQPWVKSGAEWSRFAGPGGSSRLLPTQRDAMRALCVALETNRGTHTVAGQAPTLEQFGRHLPQLLRDAAAAGIELLVASPLRSVIVAADPVDVVAEVTTAEHAASFSVGVDGGAGLLRGESVHFLGPSPSVVVLLDDGHLTIAELRDEVPRRLQEMVHAPSVDVPPDDIELLRQRLSGLVRHLPVRSPDGSVDVPDPVRPVLRLGVAWRSSTDAELTWEWRYDDDCCPLDGSDRLGGRRDPDAERELRSRVPPDLLGRTSVAGGEALSLAIHDLEHLRSLDDVEVIEEERPDFRESSAAPEISFDLVDPGSEHTDWLDLWVTVRVEGESVPLPDVLAALTLGDEFVVLPSGLFVPTDRVEFDRLREVVAAAAELRERDGDRISVGKHDLGVWAQLAETGMVDRQAAAWVRRAQALRDLTDLPRPEPVGLSTELRAYQREGFWWLAFLHDHDLGGILADDMGLGKTLQVLALMQYAVARGSTAPFLVVAPTSVVTAWRTEAARHVPGLRVGVVGRRTDDLTAIAAQSDVVVTTYTLARLDEEQYASLPWAGLVLDEAQQVKNHRSKTYAAVRGIEAPFRLAVTGTPFENRLMELWALLSIAAPGLYPWPRRFRELVVQPVEKESDDGALRRFTQRVRPFLLRRTKELVADDLPPKQEQVLDIELEPRHRKLYDAHLAKERQRILGLVDDFEVNRVAIFAALTKLRQLALDPALVDATHDRVGSAKLDVLGEQLAEVTAEGHQALVFSQFTSFLERVRHRLDAVGISTTYLDGSTRDRAAVIDRFRAGDASVFLISLKAGGVGLTLTEADYVYVLDPWWNPAAEAQAVDRAHRIGQTRHVNVYRLVAADTIEEKVMALKARKAELFARVVDGVGSGGAGIDADDIRAIFED